MELRQLRYFLAVAEELHFTRAAQRIGIAQPPLSQQIMGLEQELGTPLFVRTKRRVALTPAGEALTVYARRIFNITEQAEKDIRAIAKGTRGSLSVGSVFSALYGLVPPVLSAYHDKWPDVQVSLRELTIDQQVACLIDGSIDVGILRGPVINPHIETMSLFEEHFVAVMEAGHPLAERSSISISDIETEPLISLMPSVSHNYSSQMLAMLTSRGIALNITHFVADIHTIIALVGAGRGISLVPASFRNLQISRVVYRPIVDATPITTMQLAWHRDAVSKTLPHFIETVREVNLDYSENVGGS